MDWHYQNAHQSKNQTCPLVLRENAKGLIKVTHATKFVYRELVEATGKTFSTA
jgi:hypothetical protein